MCSRKQSHRSSAASSCRLTSTPSRDEQDGMNMYQLPITKWPHQSGAPVGAAPPTRSQLRLQRRTQTPVQNSHNGCHQPTLDPLLPMAATIYGMKPCAGLGKRWYEHTWRVSPLPSLKWCCCLLTSCALAPRALRKEGVWFQLSEWSQCATVSCLGWC